MPGQVVTSRFNHTDAFQEGSGVFQEGSSAFQEGRGVFQEGSGAFQEGSGVFQEGSGVFQKDSGAFQEGLVAPSRRVVAPSRGSGVFQEGSGAFQEDISTFQEVSSGSQSASREYNNGSSWTNDGLLLVLEDASNEANCSNPLHLATGSCGNFTVPSSLTNTTTLPGDSYFFYETEQFTVLWLLFISIVVGNIAVITALLLSKTRKSRTNFFIMHLAVADLSVGVISVLTDIVWKSTVSWYAGNVGCKIIRFAQVVVTYSSTYVLVALSIDRYDAITHPMNFSGSWRRARRLVLVAWLLSAILASPSLIFFRETSIDGVIQCWIDFSEPWQWKVYMTLVALTVFVFPTVIITACYAIIVYTIWSKSKIMTLSSKTFGAKNGEKRGGGTTHEDDSRRASSRGLIPKAKIKTVKMTFVIVFVFVLCWSPYIVFDLLQVYGYIPQTPTNVAVATFIQSLAPLNSAANPIIYCLFSTHICRNLRRIPVINWCVKRLLPCLACAQQPLEGSGRFHRYGTEYSSVSDVSSRRHTLTSIRYQPVRQGVELSQAPCTTALARVHLNTQLLTYSTKRPPHHPPSFLAASVV
ncbi:cardioacceleratory peptide receptor-like [Panulirus ornatus]|uniref:cardioacceleratory peptide receptor-like n=1 Tax=Panulirus ornatus TaxID=150431 RepID=UPI003A898021